MTGTIKVFLGEMPERVGTLYFNSSGNRQSSAFEYADTWLASPVRFAIEPGLPMARGRAFHARTGDGSAFHGAISDTEPDGWGRMLILRDHANRRKEMRATGESLDDTELTSLDYLLSVDDFSRVGALRLQDENGVFQRSSELGRPSVPPLVGLSQLLHASLSVEANTETAADLAFLRGSGTSLGGMRPKCSVLDDTGILSIGKFPSVRDTYAVTKAEVLALRIANCAGIEASQAEVVDCDGQPVTLVKRFDRTPAGTRLPYISAATLLGLEDTRADHTYTEIVDALAVYSADYAADTEELWRRIALSILINNVDDHLHNHGFLHVENGKWRLSPAFDINPFPDKRRTLKTWISEASGDAASIDSLIETASYFGITVARARSLLLPVVSSVSKWRDIGRQIGMTVRDLDPFEPAFEGPELEVARRAVRTVSTPDLPSST